MTEVQKKVKQIPNLIENGKTQPILDYKECLFEKVYVETPVDTDGDGKLDLIAVYIRRPKETLNGYQVPAIYVADPYIMTCNEDWYVPYDVDKNIEVFSEQQIKKAQIVYHEDVKKVTNPEQKRETKGFAKTSFTEEIPLDCITDWYSYFNSRGYASVFCGGLGTRGSEGLTISGSKEELLAFKAVIDWLNGSCRAFTNKTDNIEIKADWCTGNVAMSGKSYLGTLCIGVATTGVKGLKTIIPEAAISNWYAYDRYYGLNVPPLGWQGDDITLLSKYCCSRALDEADYATVKERYEKILESMESGQDRASGNYNRFWDERNYLNKVNQIKASVFIVHGLNDWNVKMNQCIPFWNAITAKNIPRRMMLHQGAHIYIHDLEGAGFNDLLHEWIDYWLYGIENGTEETESQVWVQSNLNQEKWHQSVDWGQNEIQILSFPIQGNDKKTWVDDLSLTAFDRTENNEKAWRDEITLGEEAQRYSLKYLWEPHDELRICGTVNVSFEAAIDKPTAIFSVMLVDYGEEKRLLETQEVAHKDGIIWGKNTPVADELRFTEEKEPSLYRIITRGWMNAQNRTCIWKKETIEEGKFYSYSFDTVPMDYTVKQGHKLGLILYGIDPEATERPLLSTTITVDEKTIQVKIPCTKIKIAK